jgi:hypothetical protein
MNDKRPYLALLLLSLITIAVSPILPAQEQNGNLSASEQRAIAVLKSMSEYVAQAERFSVTTRDSYDAVQKSGQKIEFGELRKIVVNRPDDLRIEAERSDGQKNLTVFDGKDITIYTAKDNVYATVSVPGSLDEAVKYAVDHLKIRLPLAVMLLSTFPSELSHLVVSADYVETTSLMDVPCDHVAARTNRGVDFQVWIAQGKEPLPRRVVITYITEPGQPQFSADFSDWNLAPDISEGLFVFNPPAGADRIQFLTEASNAAVTAVSKKGDKK